MKIDRIIHATGVIVILIYAIMTIFNFGQDYIDINLLLTLGFLLGYIGQSMKIKSLENGIKR
ncbi:hypothetical protein SanaruYs_39680 [Chryseotalea sanaruensis]|uniref:Uncharacterized protein n=1 Tax=Chryseotalea sanaruensis TaxID=2482724 RepID=A0A401UFV2_9BACT|nr:hypothetical protein SanaruYs_39680 [Chryseotalea sanaruensis]